MIAALSGEASPEFVRDVLTQQCWAHLRVSGTCMEPELLPGDTTRLASSTVRKLRWGDIVLVACPEGMRLHRLVWNGPFMTLTKADRGEYFDGARTRRAILASVVAVDRADCCRRGSNSRRLRALKSLAEGLVNWARLRVTQLEEAGW